MKTEQMSSLTRSLYRYECQYLNDAAQDNTLTGPIKASLAGRVILLAVSFILHAEAVCRAVYICFLTIKQIFSQSTQELLAKQKGECTVAYDASLRSFVAALFYQKLITPLEENRPSATQARTIQLPIRFSQATRQDRFAPQEEIRIDRGRIASAKNDLKDSDFLAPNYARSPDYEYQSLSEPSPLRLEIESVPGSAAILVDVDDCHYPESPEMQPLFGNLDAISLLNSPEILSPNLKPQLAQPDPLSHASSAPILVDDPQQTSPRPKPHAPHLDLSSRAGSEPSLVDGDDGKDPVSPKAQLFANIESRSHAGSEPSLVNVEGSEPNSPKAKPAKTSASSENEYIMVNQTGAMESIKLGQEVERIEEEGQKFQAIQLELELTKRQVDFLNKRLSRFEGNNALEGLDVVDPPSQDGELVEILNEYEKQEATELQLPGTPASVKSYDALSRSSDPMPLIIEKDPSKTEKKGPQSPRSQSSGELV